MIRRRVDDGRLSSSEGRRAYALLDQAPIRIVSHPRLRQRARIIAERFRQSAVYDATYAALAERNSTPTAPEQPIRGVSRGSVNLAGTMERDGLAGLSREELLELVRCQQEELAEREAAIERRDEKIRALEEELSQFRRPAKTLENSSMPPSRGQKANRVAGRRRKAGPKRGHVGVSRVRGAPDVVVECRPRACGGCGEPLPGMGGRRVGRSQVTELPSFAPVVIEGWQYALICGKCGVRTTGTYPAGLEPRRTFGPGVEALLSYLHERHHVGYARLVELCRDVFGLAISEGGVENALRRLVERARPTYAAIRETVRGSPVINSDETGARVAGRTHWQWAFQTAAASYHVIAPSRGGEVIDAFLDGVEPEVWGSDLYAPQVLTAAAAHQLCHSHQARDLTFAVEADTGAERLWAIELRHVFGRAIRLHREREQVTPETFARRRTCIENATDRLVFDRYVAPKSEAARLQKRYRVHRDNLYAFLYRTDVEPTNNSSERDLRPSVIHRKVIDGFRSDWGAEASAIRTSILATARKQGQNLFDAFLAIAAPHLVRTAPPPPDQLLAGPRVALGFTRYNGSSGQVRAPPDRRPAGPVVL